MAQPREGFRRWKWHRRSFQDEDFVWSVSVMYRVFRQGMLGWQRKMASSNSLKRGHGPDDILRAARVLQYLIMDELFECKAITDIDAVTSLIFASNDWIGAMNRLGFTLLFYGIDLVNLVDRTNKASLGSTAQPAYIALGLIENKGANPLSQNQYSHGYPYLKLLLRCVKPWRWSSEGRHALYIKSLNIDLNISIYGRFEHIRVANHRLVTRNDKGQLESAVCCWNADLASAFKGEMPQNIKKTVFSATMDGRRDDCVFYPTAEKCECGLESRLSSVNPADDTTVQHFKEVEAPYSRVLFDGEKGKRNDLLGAICNELLPEGRENTEVGTRTPNSTVLPFETQAQILDSLDECTYGTLAFDRTYWALARGYPYPEIFMNARGRHAFTWTAVVRENNDYRRLKSSTGHPFLAGQGVRSLYNADSEVSDKLHHVLLCCTDGGFIRIRQDKFSRGVTTFLQPFIRLHFEVRSRDPDPAWRKSRNTPIFVENLDDYIEYRDGKLVIPIVYLKDTKYLLENAELTFNRSEVRDRYCAGKNYLYSFTTRDRIFTLAETSTELKPWHERRRNAAGAMCAGENKG